MRDYKSQFKGLCDQMKLIVPKSKDYKRTNLGCKIHSFSS